MASASKMDLPQWVRDALTHHGGSASIVDVCRRKAPKATIVVTAVFPRNDNMAYEPEVEAVNALLARLADGRRIRFVDINDKLADGDGRLFDGMMADGLHPTAAAYQIWADALKPIFRELLGAAATVDRAPPPTGDPAAMKRPSA